MLNKMWAEGDAARKMPSVNGNSIVVIDSDPESVKSIEGCIRALGNGLSVDGIEPTFDAGYDLVLQKKPKILILEVDDDIELAEKQIQAVVERMPQVTVFAVSEDRSAETILRVMRAGANEYVVKPILEEDLTAALRKHGRLWLPQTSCDRAGKVITFFSPKGGVGTSTLAINVGACIYKQTKKPTIIVDLDVGAGDVCTFLNLDPQYTIGDVIVNMNRLDASFLKGVISKHSSGLNVLAEPHRMNEIKSIKGGDITKIIGMLQTMYSYVIIDLHPVIDDCSMAAFQHSDTIFLPFILSLPGIKNMQKYLQYFKGYDINQEKLKILVNRHLKKSEITVQDAEKILSVKVFRVIPNEYDTVINSLNVGEPLVTSNFKSRLNQSLMALSEEMIKLLARG